MVAEPEASKANAVKTMLDTIIAPKDAFAAIRVTPTWGLPLAVAIVLGALGAFLMVPAFQHAVPATFAHQAATNPQIAAMSREQQQQAIAIQEKVIPFTWIFVMLGVPFGALIAAVIMLVFDKIGHGEGSFGTYWAAACNIALVTSGLASLVLAVIVLARGAASFDTMQSVQQALPTLGLLVPASSVKLSAFLGAVTPFSLWAVFLTATAVSTIGRANKTSAWLAGITMLIVPALFAAAFAK